jgi:hypothetical protein
MRVVVALAENQMRDFLQEDYRSEAGVALDQLNRLGRRHA